jgi:FtsP/CotA-like multicopper oxidase with cupredoxin domain
MAADKPVNTSLLAAGLAAFALLFGIFATGVALANRTSNAAAAAGGSAGGDAVAAQPVNEAATVDVTLSEYAITVGGVVPVGAELNVVNDGEIAHNLEIVGADLATSDIAAGSSAALDASSLAPGEYEWTCTIAGHAAAGMTGTFTVAGADEVDTVAQGDHDMDAGGDGGSTMPTSAEMEQIMQDSIGSFPAETEGKGAQPMEPEILDDGTKLFELTVDEVEWEVEPGKVVEALAYNGQIPGPTLRADIGDTVTIRVINELDDEGTSLHPHGLRDHDFSIDGVTYISQEPIASGEAMDYTFVAEQPSVMMYHSHHMSLHQVLNGLAGSMIIGDYAALADIDGVVDEIVMVTNDAGSLGFTLNGKSFPATEPYSYTSGDKVIVHYYNEGLMAHPMHLHNQDGLVIAKDGYVLDDPWYMDTLNVAPGERYTVVYEMEKPGTWVWHCHILSHVKRADGSMFGMLTAVVVEPATEA